MKAAHGGLRDTSCSESTQQVASADAKLLRSLVPSALRAPARLSSGVMRIRVLPLALAISFASSVLADAPAKFSGPAEAVLLHPPFSAPFYKCGEHSGSLNFALGDALGTDCVVYEFDLSVSESLIWPRAHKSDGAKNEDWYGWRAEVLAPCECRVVGIHINETTNPPGKMIPGRATSVTFERPDGTKIVYAHLREMVVEQGQMVTPGQVIGRVGNNGYSRHPHVHIGAWRNEAPLQVRFDQYKMTPQ